MTLTEFIQRYPPRPPKRPAANNDELKLLTSSDGVIDLNQSPVFERRAHPQSPSARQAAHLWVFDEAGVPAILEHAVVSPPLASGVAKHTNLTGGGPAACGGELWVDPVTSVLYVNGGSGRYGPDTPQQLADAVSVFQALGYQVVSFGWSDENDQPARVLRDV